MAEVVWAEPALNDLDAIADYIALDNPEAARRLVQKIFVHVIILKTTLDLAQSRKSSKAGVIARSSSRRVASSTAKNPGESLYFTSCDQSGCLGLNYLAIEIKVNPIRLRQTCDNTTAKVAVIGGNTWTRWRLQPVTNVSKS